MIDIDKYIDRTIAIKINGELLKVQEPPVKLVKKFAALDGMDDVQVLEEQSNIVAEILNNNTSGKKFKPSQIDNLPASAIKAIVEAVMKSENDPN